MVQRWSGTVADRKMSLLDVTERLEITRVGASMSATCHSGASYKIPGLGYGFIRSDQSRVGSSELKPDLIFRV